MRLGWGQDDLERTLDPAGGQRLLGQCVRTVVCVCVCQMYLVCHIHTALGKLLGNVINHLLLNTTNNDEVISHINHYITFCYSAHLLHIFKAFILLTHHIFCIQHTQIKTETMQEPLVRTDSLSCGMFEWFKRTRAEQAAFCGNFTGIGYADDEIVEQVAFIRLKWAVHAKFIQLRKFGESDLEHSQKTVRERFRIRRQTHSHMKPIVV